MSDLRWGSHTEQAFSSDGLTIDWYACSLTEVEPMFSLIGFTIDVVDVAFPFRVLADILPYQLIPRHDREGNT